MGQRVICGVDDSERSYGAVAVARDLAMRLELPLMLAHVVDEPVGYPFGEPDAMQREREQREARGADVLREIAMTFDLPSETELRAESGDPAAMLRTIAEEEDAAMLVVASRGRGRIRSALFGSVTAKLVDGLRCPIMVIAPGAGIKFRKATAESDTTVVCGIDASTDLRCLAPVADRLAAALGARLLIVHADTPAMAGASGGHGLAGVGVAGVPVVLHEDVAQHEHAVQDRLERARELITRTPQVDVRAVLGDLATTMIGLADQASIQVLAIAQHSPWHRLAARADCPVLVVPQEEVRGPRPEGAPLITSGVDPEPDRTRNRSAQ